MKTNPPATGPNMDSIPDDMDDVMLSCIVCKKAARQSSIYCSDDCIRKHAQTTTTNIATALVESAAELEKSKKQLNINIANDQQQQSHMKLLSPSVKPTAEQIMFSKNNRVDVYEPKTGRCLTGNSAPTMENLRQWLQKHPTFEIVHPGSAQAMAIKAKKLQLKHQPKIVERDVQKLFAVGSQPPKIQTTLKVIPSKRVVLVNPQKPTGKQQQQQQLTPPQQQPLQKKALPKIAKIPQQVSLKAGGPTKPTTPTSKQAPNKPTTPTANTTTNKPTTPTTNKLTIPTTSKPTTPTTKQPLQAKTPATATKQNQPQQNKRKQAEQKSVEKSPTPNRSGHTEPVRVNVKKTLKEQLALRMSEIADEKCAKLTSDEVDKFVQETEREIYNLFSKDTGAKYRAKYRSLMFNIKDRKNETLFRKICDKSIEPKQLVRMSPEELASQELALWRENENKHQLEMIKKSELDLLACAKSYVLKTHKGEEVIESKISDRVTLDPSVSVEDVVSVLNNSTVSSTSENLTESSTIVKDTRIDSRFEKYLAVEGSAGGTTGIGKSAVAVAAAATAKKKGVKRSRSRSKERQSDGKKSGSSKHKRKRSRERRSSVERDKSRGDERSTKDKESNRNSTEKSKKDERDKREKEKEKEKEKVVTIKTATKKETVELAKKTIVNQPPKPLKKEESFNLIDKILEAQSTIDRILRPEETAKKEEIEKKVDAVVVAAAAAASAAASTELPAAAVVQKSMSSESDQEPSSTVTIPTPPESLFQQKDSPTAADTINKPSEDDAVLWSGSIIMVDVATFQINIQGLSGDCTNISKDLPVLLDVVGRIQTETVWEYITKIKKSFNKEILVIKFSGATEEDNDAYYTLYKYLSTRKRFGVIKTKSSCIKDFYILPLAAHKSLPSVLSPINKPGFDSGRPDLLLGMIVKNTSLPLKRPLSTPLNIPAKVARVSETATTATATKIKVKVAVIDQERYTPPTSPKMPTSARALSTSKVTSQEPVLEDGDEPYSPGGSDDDDDPMSGFTTPQMALRTGPSTQPTLISKTSTIDISPTQLDSDEIQRKMEELTRQIEAQKMEIAGMLQTTVPISSVPLIEPYSPTSLLMSGGNGGGGSGIKPIPALADISIPSNLQEILNSIQKKSGNVVPSVPSIDTHQILDSDEEYTPTAIGSGVGMSYQTTAADYIPSKNLLVPSGSSHLLPLPQSQCDEAFIKVSKEPSKLAQLTDAELLNMVPDDIRVEGIPLPATGSTSRDMEVRDSKYTLEEPPPPGLEDEYIP